jgi:hypothetical protein
MGAQKHYQGTPLVGLILFLCQRLAPCSYLFGGFKNSLFMSFKIAAVVVTHNRPKLLAQCVEALRSQTRRPNWVIVVGNDVCSETRAWLDKQPGVLAVNLDKIPTALNLQATQKFLNRSLKAGFKSRFVKPHHLFSSGRVPISRFTSRKTG